MQNTAFDYAHKPSVSSSEDPQQPSSAPGGSSWAASTLTPKPSLMESFREWARKLLGGKSDSSLREVLEEVLEEHEEEASQLQPQEKVLLHNVLSFGDLTVQDIMVPRPEITAVSHDITLEALKKHIMEQGHTRIPVYRGNLDKIEGFVHVKDVIAMLAGDVEFMLASLLRPMLFVPPSMKIIDLLVKMRRLRSHVAIVVDEYGGTDGLVTLEDVFEEIVGDIQDEHDEQEEPEMFKRTTLGIEADARVRIDILEQKLGINLRTENEGEEFDTLGGLIFFQLGHVPVRGEIIAHASGLVFEILDADARRIKTVRIRVHSPT